MIRSQNSTTIFTSDAILGNHPHAGFNIALIEVTNNYTSFRKGLNHRVH